MVASGQLPTVRIAAVPLSDVAAQTHMLLRVLRPLGSGRVIGTEALLRWRLPDGSLVPPDVFIPMGEKSGLIQRVTAQVLARVAADAGDLLTQHPDFHIGVKLARAGLQSPQTVAPLAQLLRERGVQ
jgi:sensor c-di-GMP phosphodiesterase-like protein